MKLVLKKATVTKLSDEQMKKFVGGLRGGSSNKSCDTNSCDSQHNAGSCNSNSCSCAAEIDEMFA